MNTRFILLLLSISLCTALPATAAIYRYVDANGVQNFTNVPPDTRYRLLGKDARYSNLTRPPAAFRFYTEADRSRYAPQIQAAASASKLDPALLHAVISAESGYNAYARSNKGALGLMQLTPDTAIRYGVTNRLDPLQNVKAGARYLRDLMAMFNDNVPLALAAYNAGEHAVIKSGNRIPPFPETAAYVPRVLAYYKAYRSKS